MGRSQSDTAHIARLREQVDALMKDRVTPLVANAAGRVEAVAHNAVDAVREQAGTITSKVREHPLLAVLIAAGIGRPVDQSRPSAWDIAAEAEDVHLRYRAMTRGGSEDA